MQQLGKTTSPIVDKTLKRKQYVQESRRSLMWGGINLLLAGFMYFELAHGPLFGVLTIMQPILWYLECGLALLFTTNFLWDILAYLVWKLSATVVEINPLQRKLMGVQPYEVGFRDPLSGIHSKVAGATTSTPTPSFSPSSFTSNRNRSSYSGLSTPVTPPHLTPTMHNSFRHFGSFSAVLPLDNTLSPLAPTPSPNHRTSLVPTPSPQAHRTSLVPTPSPQAHRTSLVPTPSPQAHRTSLVPTPSPQARRTSLVPTLSPQAHRTSLVPTPSPQARRTSLTPTRSPLDHRASLTPTPLGQRFLSSSPGSSSGYGGNYPGTYMSSGYSPVDSCMYPAGMTDRAGYASDNHTSRARSYSVAGALSPMTNTLSPLFRDPGSGSPLSATNTLSPLFREADASGLRARFTGAGVKSSPLSRDECITDPGALKQFLTEQDEKENRIQAVSPDMSPGTGTSFWNYNRSLSDRTQVLRKFQYQNANRSLQQAKVKDDDTDEPINYRADEVWSSQHVKLDDVDRWIEHLRKWLANTVLTYLVNEIVKINDILSRIGCEDMQIGEVSISILKQLASSKAQHIPTLKRVIPFLEVSANQEYIVDRIRVLGSGGAMSDFKWNGGGIYKGKPWAEHLPSDAVILMHLLCTYMDSRLPPHPKYPDGKTFTTQYFMKTPDKPDLTKKKNLLLYQSKVNPPHFKVILEHDVLNPPKGRKNIFHAILLFLHYIHVKQHGMLGRINLGLSGINILWVMDVNQSLVVRTDKPGASGLITNLNQSVKHVFSPKKDV